MTASPSPTLLFFSYIVFNVSNEFFGLFVFLPWLRGRTRGRVVLDEEDSMDGTEIAEPIGPLDTGETLNSPSFFLVLCSSWSWCRWRKIAHPAVVSQEVFPQWGLTASSLESLFLAPLASTSGWMWKGLSQATNRNGWSFIFFPLLPFFFSSLFEIGIEVQWERAKG